MNCKMRKFLFKLKQKINSEESIELVELKAEIIESMKKLPARERELIEYKFFKEKIERNCRRI